MNVEREDVSMIEAELPVQPTQPTLPVAVGPQNNNGAEQ